MHVFNRQKLCITAQASPIAEHSDTTWNRSTSDIPPRISRYQAREYLQQLIGSTQKFIRSIRWRALVFLNPEITQEDKETFGFKSTKSALNIPELKEFEDEVLEIIEKVQFKTSIAPSKSNYQKMSKKSKSQNLTISADKTTNFCNVEPKQYENLLEENIPKDYKKQQ